MLALSVRQLSKEDAIDDASGITGYAVSSFNPAHRERRARPTHPPDTFTKETIGVLLGPELRHRNRHFFGVGINTYRGPKADRLADLQSCHKDVSDMHNLFEERFGYTSVTQHHDLGVDDMDDAFEAFANTLQQGDLAVVYFAGHGMQVRNSTYLIPSTDADFQSEKDLTERAINTWRMLERLFEVGAGQVPRMGTKGSRWWSSFRARLGGCSFQQSDF
eukprot:m.470320 g.470320  ORF g.470320 m.470320 type:complete len:219 (-) comp20368_c0_seq15:925-1581(-)